MNKLIWLLCRIQNHLKIIKIKMRSFLIHFHESIIYQLSNIYWNIIFVDKINFFFENTIIISLDLKLYSIFFRSDILSTKMIGNYNLIDIIFCNIFIEVILWKIIWSWFLFNFIFSVYSKLAISFLEFTRRIDLWNHFEIFR